MEMTKGPRSRLSSGDLPPEYETATMEEPTRLTPFDCADLYRARGWEGTIPLPASSKTPPPSGYTGAAGHMPSGADVEEWRRHGFRAGGRTYPAGNLALRLPRDVIGLDVDHYGTKSGGDTLAGLITRWGPLPPTKRSTSRSDGISGIRLYRLPRTVSSARGRPRPALTSSSSASVTGTSCARRVCIPRGASTGGSTRTELTSHPHAAGTPRAPSSVD